MEYRNPAEKEYELDEITALGHEGQGVATALLKNFTGAVETDSKVTAVVSHEETRTRVVRTVSMSNVIITLLFAIIMAALWSFTSSCGGAGVAGADASLVAVTLGPPSAPRRWR